jgi:hypothetical protein
MKNWQLLVSGALAGVTFFVGFILGLQALYIIAEEDEEIRRQEEFERNWQ